MTRDSFDNDQVGIEVFYVSQEQAYSRSLLFDRPGWYWRHSAMSALYDPGVAMGPFKTEQEAMDDAQKVGGIKPS